MPIIKMKATYVVVEFAGYERECDVRTFDKWADAAAHVENTYTEDERCPWSGTSIHVGIRADYEDGTSEYVS